MLPVLCNMFPFIYCYVELGIRHGKAKSFAGQFLRVDAWLSRRALGEIDANGLG